MDDLEMKNGTLIFSPQRGECAVGAGCYIAVKDGNEVRCDLDGASIAVEKGYAVYKTTDTAELARIIRLMAFSCKSKDVMSCEFGNEFYDRVKNLLEEELDEIAGSNQP